MPERRENCKKQIVSNTNHNRMPERRENCKKQIVSNTNNNRMPERRENCKKTKQSVILTTIECRKEKRIVKTNSQ